METFKMKTYADSFLYNEISKSGKSINKSISDFIIRAHRIDKNEPSFSGIIEEIKRHQSSPVLISVLFNENVVLCVGDSELPLAFKVFDAKDPKSGKNPKVFIDLTGKIEYKNGYYVIRRNEADKLCAMLFDALIYLLYRNQRFKLTNNPNIVLASTKCYVSMFNYILDYLRIIGFSQNKDRISYLTALYYLHGMIGYSIDDPYAKSIATKVANIQPRQATAFDYFIDDESMFDNIGTYIPTIVSTFKLKGLDLPVFMSRWTNSFGPGTEYGVELFTSFLIVLINAYTGSYIIRQKQVETACGDTNLVKVATAIIRAGTETYDISRFAEGAEAKKFEVHSESAQDMSRSMKLKEEVLAKGMSIERFDNVDTVAEAAREIIHTCKDAKIENRITQYATESILNGISAAYESTWSTMHGEEPDYCPGTLTEAVKIFRNYMNESSINSIWKDLKRDVNHLSELIEEYSDLPPSIKQEVMTNISEMRNISTLLK